MIRKQDILDRAAEWQLRPDVVEKDYVLGWLLAALAVHPETGRYWVFKGGTCIKKCYVETYRFSEDLDFSLQPEASYTQGALREVLETVARTASDLSGIDFPTALIVVRERQDSQGRRTFQGRLAYRGPLVRPDYPRVLLDLTQHEPLCDDPVPRTPYHPYPDALPDGASPLTYSLDELLAEKTRALYERTRPRDLYDVVYLLSNRPGAVDLARVQELFRRKCEVKSLPIPSAEDLLRLVHSTEELRGEWENMLAHQLPSLPGLDGLLVQLPEVLRWIDQPEAVPSAIELPEAPIPAGMSPLVPAGVHYWGGGAPLEAFRFAGANRLLVEFAYDGRRRLAEPYSLRRASTGNVLLYAWEQGGTHIKAFDTDKIQDVRVTATAFRPRYRIELTSEEPLSIPSQTQHPRLFRSQARHPRLSRPRRQLKSGPTYVFECSYCGKQFRHSKNDPTLRKHKTKEGWACSGRHGYWVDTAY